MGILEFFVVEILQRLIAINRVISLICTPLLYRPASGLSEAAERINWPAVWLNKWSRLGTKNSEWIT